MTHSTQSLRFCAERADQLLNDHLSAVHRRTDRLFSALLMLEWVAGIAAALWITPRTWIGSTSYVHQHVWAAIVLGGVAALFPIWMIRVHSGAASTRHAVAVAQMTFSGLFIHLTGGRIETHFHVFGSLAFLALYRDWRVLVTATAIVTLDHWARGVFWPQSVFGTAFSSPWRWAEHAAWVVYGDLFLIPACIYSTREMRQIAEDRAKIEASHDLIENEVRERTAELNEARSAAESASRTKSMFLANMSHEIRTPMTAILGYSDLLRDTSLGEGERQDYVKIIRRNGETLLELINEILDVSKIEAGKLTVQAAVFRLDSIVAEVESTMRVRAMGKGLELNVRYADSAKLELNSDAFRIRQILMNLVGNAIKFTQSGSVDILVRSETDATGGDHAVIEVTDSGIGMSENEMAGLFRPFTQADESTTRRFGGTGLGLTISRRLAELLGGELTMRSTPGAGSTFSVRLPRGEIGDGLLPRPDAPDRADSENAELSGRILLAEDGPDNRRLLIMHLSRAGATVEVAENGRIACEMALDAAASGVPYSLIVMDMQMPELDGYDAARKLRESGITTPIIALTAHAMDTDRAKCLAAGCNDYTTKPINRARLLAMCERWMRATRQVVESPRGGGKS